MFPSLQDKLRRFEELERQLQDPAILADRSKLPSLQREHGGLAKVSRLVRDYNALDLDIETARAILKEERDHESRAYADEELKTLLERKEALEADLEELVAAGDTILRGSLILELRAGTGGEEAALFARDLFEMYQRYADAQGWKWEILDSQAAAMGGIKEMVLSVSGEGAFHRLQFESGGHRVQRVPETETQGRIHTSTATVAVLPEATEVEIDIKPEDLRIDTFFASGPGGQKVNKTASAIRITHFPTNTVVSCQDEKSQHKNKAKAMRVLRSRLFEAKQRQQQQERADQRRTLIGTGDRSQRIRTYNFPQNRLTDHRIGLTLYKLDRILLGDLDELLDALLEYDREERLKGGGMSQTG
jgi:peptide chain release factor 1